MNNTTNLTAERHDAAAGLATIAVISGICSTLLLIMCFCFCRRQMKQQTTQHDFLDRSRSSQAIANRIEQSLPSDRAIP